MCEMTEILEHAERHECVTCGHESPRESEPEAAPAARVVKDAHGTVLLDGDVVMLIKDLPLNRIHAVANHEWTRRHTNGKGRDRI